MPPQTPTRSTVDAHRSCCFQSNCSSKDMDSSITIWKHKGYIAFTARISLLRGQSVAPGLDRNGGSRSINMCQPSTLDFALGYARIPFYNLQPKHHETCLPFLWCLKQALSYYIRSFFPRHSNWHVLPEVHLQDRGSTKVAWDLPSLLLQKGNRRFTLVRAHDDRAKPNLCERQAFTDISL